MDRLARHKSQIATAAVMAVVACAVSSCGGIAQPSAQAQKFCVVMPDSIGLYVGNSVTQMGYKIGTVDTIEPQDTGVTIGFSIDNDRPVPADVKAVTRSTSLLADRSLELVGNYSGGPRLSPGRCIPRDRAATPMSLSQVIGSATNFINAIAPDGSTNIQDTVVSIDQAAQGNGSQAARLLTTSSALLDNPDQAISDMAAITRNVVLLTDMLKDSRNPLKEIIRDMPVTMPDVLRASDGAGALAEPIPQLISAASDIEGRMGDSIQLTLDTVADAIRHLTPHANFIASLFNDTHTGIDWLATQVNNHQFNVRYRPPLFRVRAPNGQAVCGWMNSQMPGSCADVGGQPYAVDAALLQYVLMEAHRR
jgi:phospholipid/cholesterol/gamma-HCH transport system substrate-binding protein